MTLPMLLVLNDRTASPRPLRETVAAPVDGCARAVVLREKDLGYDERRRLADTLAELLAPVGGLLLVAGPEVLGHADGVHLAATDPWPVPRPGLVGRSCHSTADVTRGGDEGADYVTVSPVYPTLSKPGYGPPLGSAGLARLAALPAAPPAYAIGGITPVNAANCLAAGAAGVAVMGAVMRAPRPDRCVAALLDAISEVAA